MVFDVLKLGMVILKSFYGEMDIDIVEDIMDELNEILSVF